MKTTEQIQDKPLECPVSQKGRNKFKTWTRRLGLAGFLFFLIKGLIWLAIFIFGAGAIKSLFE